jgi:beta-glucosidase
MTLQEKLTLIHGTQEDPSVYQGQAGYLAGIPRLGIPGLRFADGPPGVLTRHPSQAETATMGVAATFSVKDAEDNGLVIGREDRALGIDVSLQPFVNIDRDLEFGRGYNTFGEDPFLTSQMGVAEIKGIQSQHVMAQVKHYVGYDSNNENTYIDDQTLHEVYVAPFDAAVNAGVASIMCSYNRLNGTYACGNKDSLTTILRDQIGFKGFVTSDWGATHAVNFINAGLDMEMPGEPDPKSHEFTISSYFDSQPVPPPPSPSVVEANADMFGGHIPEEPAPQPENIPISHGHKKLLGSISAALAILCFGLAAWTLFRNNKPNGRTVTAPLAVLCIAFAVASWAAFTPGSKVRLMSLFRGGPEKMPQALKDGTVTEATVTRAAGHVLYEIAQFGYLDGQSKHAVTEQSIDENAKIIEKTAEDSAVLLKNDNHILPLKNDELNSVVLVGPTAGQIDSIGINGERSVGLPQRQIGPLAAMKKISSNSNIGFAVADDMTGTTIPANALSHDGQPGLERSASSSPNGGAGVAAQTDSQLDFTLQEQNALPPNSIVSWKGTLTPPHAGVYWIYLQALGTNASMNLDGKPFARTGAFQGGVHGDILQANQDNAIPTTDNLDNVRRAIDLTAGPHAIEISLTPDSSSAPVQVRLNWYTPEQRQADFEHAVEAARHAKVAVVFAWTRLEPVFGLPGDQDKLIEQVAAANPNTVVVLNTSQPVALPWVDKVKGVLEMWWPGDEGGWSTANILLGKTSPAGRLPVSWGKQLSDYAATDPSHPERSMRPPDHKTTYSEGVNVGYRWFDKQNIEPLFAFGHGLSYTTFDYSSLSVAKTPDGGLDVKINIKNTGPMASDEVPQVYLGAPGDVPDGVQFPVHSLAAFDHVHLAPGESKQVTLHVAQRQVQYWSTKDQKWMIPTGKRTVSVGASSRDLRLHQDIE